MSLEPFLHLKFTSLRPVPQYGHQLPFAHLVDPAIHDLPESLKTDVQREGIKRYLLQNFDDGSFVREVVKERLPGNDGDDRGTQDGDGEQVKDSDGMYLVVNRSWARTVGDQKLHLSLYVYQEDKHCATWHAYTDRTISYSRVSEPPTEETSDLDPDGRGNGDGDEEHDRGPSPIPNEDPYSPPSALAQYVATMDSRPSSPFEIPARDSERPRFDRPYKEPVADDPPPTKTEDQAERDEIAAKRSRRSRKPRAEAPATAEEEPIVVEQDESKSERRSRSSRNEKKLDMRSESESDQSDERSKKDRDPAPLNEVVEGSGKDTTKHSKHSIVKSKPIRQRSSRNERKEENEKASEGSRSRSASPSSPPVKTRSSRSTRRAPSPESRSPSPPSRSARRNSRTLSHGTTSTPSDSGEERGRRARRPERAQTRSASPTSRSPSPPPRVPSRASRAKRSSSRRSRSPSPPRADKSRNSRNPPSESRSRSPPTVQEKSEVRQSIAVEKRKQRSEETRRSSSRSRSRSPSPAPTPAAALSTPPKTRKSDTNDDRKPRETRDRSRSRSRSPPGERRSRSRHSRNPRPTSPPSRSRSRSISPVFRPPRASNSSSTIVDSPTAEEEADPQLPTWRSVSRNRHRRPPAGTGAEREGEDSDDDTLVRGNLDDESLDIPAGGESTLLRYRHEDPTSSRAQPVENDVRRSSSSRRRRTITKDEGFDPEAVVKRNNLQVEDHDVGSSARGGGGAASAASLKNAVGGWFKSVGSMIATEAKLVVGKAEEDVERVELGVEELEEREREDKRKRKEERGRRREERARRREEQAKSMHEKEEELERMVDRAEDATEGMMEKAERSTIRKEKEARKHKQKDEEDEEETEARQRRSRSEREKESDSTRSRSKHRSFRPVSPDGADTGARKGQSHHRGDDGDTNQTTSGRQHRSRQAEASRATDSLHDPEVETTVPRPALRSRAMSISASVDAGIKGIRESVSKIVSDARQVQVDDERLERDAERQQRKIEKAKRRIERERKALEDEKRQIEEDEALERAKRRALKDAERKDKEEQQRLLERAREPRAEEPDGPARRSKHRDGDSDRGPSRMSHRGRDTNSEPSVAEHIVPRSTRRRPTSPDSDSELPPAPSSDNFPPPYVAAFEDNDSEASSAPVRSRRRRVPSTPGDSASVTYDTDMSDAPSRSSRSVRSMDRSESEADTPAHIEAKRNARRNSTTIPIETIRALREQQLHSGTRSIPGSPVSSKSRRAFPVLKQVPNEGSVDDTRAEPFRSTIERHRYSDDDHDEYGTGRLGPPDAPVYPRRLSPAPFAASPVSSYGAASPVDYPLRPRPVKPQSYRPLPPAAAKTQPRPTGPSRRVYTPASSGESSDEADPSRPPSVRSRRGYSSAGSGTSDVSTRRRRAAQPPSPSYRFPRSDSDVDDDDDDVNPPLRRTQSFSRTQPSYPFTTDDEGDSEPDVAHESTTRAGSSKSEAYVRDQVDSAYEESELGRYGRSGRDRYRARDASSYEHDPEFEPSSPPSRAIDTSGGGGGSGRSRTMVSKPSSSSSRSNDARRLDTGPFAARNTNAPLLLSDHRSLERPYGYSTTSPPPPRTNTSRTFVTTWDDDEPEDDRRGGGGGGGGGGGVDDVSSFSRATTPYRPLSDPAENPSSVAIASSSLTAAASSASFIPQYDPRVGPGPTSTTTSSRVATIGGFTGFDLRRSNQNTSSPTTTSRGKGGTGTTVSPPGRDHDYNYDHDYDYDYGHDVRDRGEERESYSNAAGAAVHGSGPQQKRKGVSSSSVAFGANRAPVGRRAAKRLGVID